MIRKIIIILGCATVTILSIIIILSLLSGVPLKNRFYLKDRITGTFTMTVYGKDYDPVDEILEYENEGTKQLNIVGSNFSIKGGKYGSYKISFSLDNEELFQLTGDELFAHYTSNPTLTYQYINTNWWNVTKMKLSADMTLVNGNWVINMKTVYSETLEDGIYSEHTITKTFTYDEIMNGNGIISFEL
ncbi:MAG: hypothetical protein ACK5JH_02895 [Anaerocolumna sp.]